MECVCGLVEAGIIGEGGRKLERAREMELGRGGGEGEREGI